VNNLIPFIRAQEAGRKRQKPIGSNSRLYEPASFNISLANCALTDLGNVDRFITRFGDQFLACDGLGWLAWDGRRWAQNGAKAKLDRAIQKTIRLIAEEAKAIEGTPEDFGTENKRGEVILHSERLRAWAMTSQGASHVRCIAGLAAPHLMVSTDDFDADPFMINVLNGTLVIAKHLEEPYVTLQPHNPEDRITMLAHIVYDPDATCPQWDDFLNHVQPKPEIQRLLYQWNGLSLTGDVSEQKFAFYHGGGRNGKSVFVDTIAHIAGDYGTTVPIETFLASGRPSKGSDATPDLAKLPGVRFLRTSEPKKGAKLNEALIKQMTGGEPVDARDLRKSFFSFKPQFKLTIQGNYKPRINGHDEGIWSRLLLIPWRIFIPEQERDPHLVKKLRQEASGILNRLLAGLCDWLDHGLVIPTDVTEETGQFRADSNPLGQFLEDCTRHAIGKRTQATELHKVYTAWAKANGEASHSPKALSQALKERGIPDIKSSVQWWVDVELTKRENDFMDLQADPLATSGAAEGTEWPCPKN
jgi:putative DNA primase/helicase